MKVDLTPPQDFPESVTALLLGRPRPHGRLSKCDRGLTVSPVSLIKRNPWEGVLPAVYSAALDHRLQPVGGRWLKPRHREIAEGAQKR